MTDDQAFARLGEIRLAAATFEGAALGWCGAGSVAAKATYRLVGSSTSTFGGVVGFASKPARRMHAAPLGQLEIPCADRSLNQEGSP